MIVAEQRAHVAASEFLATAKARIKNSVHGMRLLSAQLYTMPIRAVVREICTNAYDANQLTGSKKPVIISLPDKNDPVLYIKDTGPGISDERMMTCFLAYFETDKHTTNEQLGGFGLGSKSPIAYADNFSIVSVHAGWKRTYIAHTSASGELEIGKVHEAPSNEPTGVEIGVPVDEKDFKAFADAVAYYIPFFPEGSVKVFGDANVTPVTYYPDEFPTCKSVDKGPIKGSYVKVGPVPYDIDWYQVFPDDRTLAYFLAQTPLEFNVPIGSVSIHPSREKLNLTDDTLNTVRPLAQKVIEHIKKVYHDAVDACPTLWEARFVHMKYVRQYQYGGLFDDHGAFYWLGAKFDVAPLLRNAMFVAPDSPTGPIRFYGGDVALNLNYSCQDKTFFIYHDMQGKLNLPASKIRISSRIRVAYDKLAEMHPSTFYGQRTSVIIVTNPHDLSDKPTAQIFNLSDFEPPAPVRKPKLIEGVSLRAYVARSHEPVGPVGPEKARALFQIHTVIAEDNKEDPDYLHSLTREKNKKACWTELRIATPVTPYFGEMAKLPSILRDYEIFGINAAVKKVVSLEGVPSLTETFRARLAEVIANDDAVAAAKEYKPYADIETFRRCTNTGLKYFWLRKKDETKMAWGPIFKELEKLFQVPNTRLRPKDSDLQSAVDDILYLARVKLLPDKMQRQFQRIPDAYKRYKSLLDKHPLLGVFGEITEFGRLDNDQLIHVVKTIEGTV